MKRLFTILCALTLTCAISNPSGAASFMFYMGDNSSVDTSKTNDVLQLEAVLNDKLDDLSFDLEEGKSETFYFATFSTDETWIDDDDLNPGTVTAYVDFDNPELQQAIGGTSIGFSAFFHFIQGWNLSWENPVEVNFGPQESGQFIVGLSDVSSFSWFWMGPDDSCLAANVYATVTLNSAPVPIPSAAWLLGSGLLGLLGLRRKNKSSFPSEPLTNNE
jgi:hypothetical protein